jgi:uncharacterized membrane protein
VPGGALFAKSPFSFTMLLRRGDLASAATSSDNEKPVPATTPSRGNAPLSVHRAATLIVMGLMLLFVAWFSAYSIRLHDAQLTHKSDLGQMDQAIWNTAHGRILQETKVDRPSTRLTDHVEPIFLPVSLVLRLWDDVRALLVLQAVFLAAGAWFICLFAQRRLAAVTPAVPAAWSGVVFAAAYLLAPALQAAAVSEFHALPLAAPFIAAALWAAESRRWGWFVLAAVLVAMTQEGAALLTLTLGLYAAARALFASRDPSVRRAPGLAVGAGIAAFGVVWFYIATFVIIPRFAAEAYAIGQTPYAARYGALGDSFADVVFALITQPLTVLRIAAEPLRAGYLAGLLLPVAGLALLGPELLLLSLPLLLANLLSSYPLQYSGELHYSAALVPFFAAAGAAGAARLLGWLARLRLPVRWTGPTLLALVIVCALGYQVAEGFTPLGREFRLAGWPRVTKHERLLTQFAAQIPVDAAVSTTPALHPHLSHRQSIYVFPVIADTGYVLVDVSGTTDQHPVDVRKTLDGLLASGEFGVLDAADGYLLLQRGAPARDIPTAFYDFVRSDAPPEHALDVLFGEDLILAGYSIDDNPKWRLTRLRFHWRVTGPLSPDTVIRYQALAPSGAVVDDDALRPLPALVWLPPGQWQPGQTYVVETLAWYLPATWAPVVAVDMGGQRVWPALPRTGSDVAVSPEGRLRLPAWTRGGGVLVPYTAPSVTAAPSATFALGDWQVRLAGWGAPHTVAPGADLPVSLQWAAPGPSLRDDSVFIHLRDAAGGTVARGDAGPTWFVPQPASRWPAPATVWDAHVVPVPPDLAAGRYDLVAGWYDWQTGTRLPLTDDAGNPAGDEYVLGAVTVDPQAGPVPDACCLMVGECCASLE